MKKRTIILGLIIGVFLFLALLYATNTPPWQAPDEPAHYNGIRYIAEQGRLPVLTVGCYDQAYLGQLTSQKFPDHLSINPVCYEHYQPPLYYILATPIYKLSDGNLIVLRLFSAILGAISLILVYKTIWLFMPNPTLALGTTAFVAFVPMHLTILTSVNNDSLAELLFVLLVYLLLHWFYHLRLQGKLLPLYIGVVLGLILITKVTIYISLPLVALVLFLGNSDFRILFKNTLRAFLPAFLIVLPLYARNHFVYGAFDILGLRRHDLVVVGQLRPTDYVAEIGWWAYLKTLSQTVFHSFWGQFGWMAVPMDNRVYLILNILQLLAICGLGIWLWKGRANNPVGGQGLWLMATIILLAVGVFIGLNRSFVQFQGRYFFTALMPLGFFFSLGLTEALHRDWALQMAGLLCLFAGAVALSSLLNGGLDRWGVLLSGLAVGAFTVRYWVPLEKSDWFMAGIYVALAGLAAVSLWWFIIPNL